MDENNIVENVLAEDANNNAESTIKIADDVVAVIAGVAVSEVQGVASMAGGFAGGISEVFKRKEKLIKRYKSRSRRKRYKNRCKYYS